MEENREHIRVFVIDPSILMRRILSRMLQKEEGINLVGTSCNYDSETVLREIELHQPDILFLGVDREGSDEMKLFFELTYSFADLHIILLTPLSREGAQVALKGVRNGAIDYVTKPEKNKGIILAERHFYKRVIPLIRAIPKLNRKKRPAIANTDDRTVSSQFFTNVGEMNPASIELVVIGGCLGGVSSIYQVLSKLPKRLPVPVIIVQHMPKIYTKVFSEELNKQMPFSVVQADNDTILKPGTVYIAPGGFHSVIRNEGGRKRIGLHKGPREHKCRPSVDVLLRSAVQEYGGRLLGVFLSGDGKDGVLGALKILENGGAILLESRESALSSELAKKIKYINSDIPEVSASSMAKEIMKTIQSTSHKSDYMYIKEGLDSSNNFMGSIEA